MPLPVKVDAGGADRDASPPLFGHEIGDSVAIVHFTNVMRPSRIKQHPLSYLPIIRSDRTSTTLSHSLEVLSSATATMSAPISTTCNDPPYFASINMCNDPEVPHRQRTQCPPGNAGRPAPPARRHGHRRHRHQPRRATGDGNRRQQNVPTLQHAVSQSSALSPCHWPTAANAAQQRAELPLPSQGTLARSVFYTIRRCRRASRFGLGRQERRGERAPAPGSCARV